MNEYAEIEVDAVTKEVIRMFCRRWHQSEPVVVERLFRAWKRRHENDRQLAA